MLKVQYGWPKMGIDLAGVHSAVIQAAVRKVDIKVVQGISIIYVYVHFTMPYSFRLCKI